MTQSWMSVLAKQFKPIRPFSVVGRGKGVALLFTVLLTVGCTKVPAAAESDPVALQKSDDLSFEVVNRAAPLPPPAPEHIEYDRISNTLKLYQLPGAGRWLVQLPHATSATPAVARHRLPSGIDPDETFVFYTTPNGRFSSPVTLRQIELSQSKVHSSLLR